MSWFTANAKDGPVQAEPKRLKRSVSWAYRYLGWATMVFSSAALQAQFTGTANVGGALPRGSIVTNGPGSYKVVGGGSRLLPFSSDQFFFAFREITNDFDVRVRVESLGYLALESMAGLMVRESLKGNSRLVFNVTYTESGAWMGLQWRSGYAEGASDNGSNNFIGSGRPRFPDLWLRLRRVGDVFLAYRGTNGRDWILQGQVDTTQWLTGPMPPTVLLGFAVCAWHNERTATVTAEFREYGNVPRDPVSIAAQPMSAVVPLSSPHTFEVQARGYDPFSYQWFRDGTPLPGATNSSYTLPAATEADEGVVFSVEVRNPVNAIESQPAILTVSRPVFLSSFTGQADIGGALPEGTWAIDGPGSFTLMGGGADVWHASDQCFYTYAPVDGDFDVRVRLESVELISRFTKAGIMARETLQPDSRMVFVRATPPDRSGFIDGANDLRTAFRTGLPGNGVNGGQNETGQDEPAYPNAWLRLARIGSLLRSFTSRDGMDWANLAILDTAKWRGGALPSRLLLGLAVTSHEQGTAAQAQFREFGDTFPQAPVIIQQPLHQTVRSGEQATFQVRLPGFYDPSWWFQWYTNGTPVPGVNEPTYVTAPAALDQEGQEVHAQITSDWGTISSAPGVLHVDDSPLPLVLLSASSRGQSNGVLVFFSKPLDPISALNASNYSIEPGMTVIGVSFQPGSSNGPQSVVRLETSLLQNGATYQLLVRDLRDQENPSRPIEPNPSMVSLVHCDAGPDGAVLVREDFSAGNGGYAVKDFNDPESSWFYDETNATWKVDGSSKGFETTPGSLLTSPSFPVSCAGRVFLRIQHRYNFEFFPVAWDGGQVRLSINNGPYQTVPGASFLINGHNSVIAGFNSLFNQEAFSGMSEGWASGEHIVSEADLGKLSPGDTVSVGFMAAWDIYVKEDPPNWEIDSVEIIEGLTEAVQFATPLQDQTVTEPRSASFVAELIGTQPIFAQWFSNGVAIADATNLVYATPPATPPEAFDGVLYSVVVSNAFGVSESRPATLRVLIDTEPPRLVAAKPVDTLDQVLVTFSEPVVPGTALDPSDYSVQTVLGDSLVTLSVSEISQTQFLLHTTLQPEGADLLLAAAHVRDLSSRGNTTDPGQSLQFSSLVFSPGFVRREFFLGDSSSEVSQLTNDIRFPFSPDLTDFATQLEGPFDRFDSYGQRISGFLLPPVSGSYNFFISSDDQSEFWLSTDQNRCNRVLVAREPQCLDRRYPATGPYIGQRGQFSLVLRWRNGS